MTIKVNPTIIIIQNQLQENGMDLLVMMEDTLGLSKEAKELVQKLVPLFEEMGEVWQKQISYLLRGLMIMAVTLGIVALLSGARAFFPALFPEIVTASNINTMLVNLLAFLVGGGTLGFLVSKAVYREKTKALKTSFRVLREQYGPGLMVEALNFIDMYGGHGLVLGREFKEGIARFREKKYRASLQKASA